MVVLRLMISMMSVILLDFCVLAVMFRDFLDFQDVGHFHILLVIFVIFRETVLISIIFVILMIPTDVC